MHLICSTKYQWDLVSFDMKPICTNVVWFLSLNIYVGIVDFESILKFKNQNLQIPRLCEILLTTNFFNLKQPISLKFKVTFEL